jgi:hypothetical protein
MITGYAPGVVSVRALDGSAGAVKLDRAGRQFHVGVTPGDSGTATIKIERGHSVSRTAALQ